MNAAMERKRPRKLNLNAPLLSTRRPPGGYISDEASCLNSVAGWKDSSDGIPFCWEQAPGKPKNSERSSNVDEAETPRPKPPPCRWRPPKEETNRNYDHNHDHHDEGCDVDDYDDVFSDAVEVLSLTEAIDIVEKTEKLHGSTKSLGPTDLDGLNLAMSLKHSDCPSPSFMIERFLPDAIELAASSALNMSKTKLPYLCNYSDQSPCVSQSVIKRPPLSSPKGCGLEMLLPWRMKHKLCSVRNPVKEKPTNIVQPKASAKQKKLVSSIVEASSEWRCK
ncbi:Tetratricopeptide repeat (TPR)-containing protein isoform 1 [Hibiscus syriacus]|uniref:Tetratricopeptide repeat (TPR)-containing protein isoform 1 n=1 Tax=Hibiscus syriacus TaxID=106335 RepID=A0A6A3BSK0_HIBSY|nr:Tetratricopeptide repeat (TPR)-containing protein isoform 1 [Hibiscus syriacus]